MPFLDAKALETDPEGMAFLRSVIRPDFSQEEASLPPLLKAPPSFEAPPQGQADSPRLPISAEAPVTLPVA